MMDVFLIVWLLFCGIMASVFLVAFNADRVVVFVLSRIDAPVYGTARMVAALLYQHPDEWKAVGSYGLAHPKLGEIRAAGPAGLHIEGPFGGYDPSYIERRIIWDAVVWYRRDHIRGLLARQISPQGHLPAQASAHH